MEPLIALAIAILFALLLKKPLRKAPLVFYIVAVALDILFLSHVTFTFAPNIARTVFPYMQRCLLSFAFLSVVMFIGVLPDTLKIKKDLLAVRGELSIFAALLSLGHIVHYLVSYLGRIFLSPSTIDSNLLVSFALSSLLVILLAVLTVTSFKTVRSKMNVASWKKLQKLAYVFYGLIYVHLVLILLPVSAHLSEKAIMSVVFYSAIMLIYLVARLRLYLVDRGKEQDQMRGTEEIAD